MLSEKKCRLASGTQLYPGVRNSLRVLVAVRSQKRLVKTGQEVFAPSNWRVLECCAPQLSRVESPPFSDQSHHAGQLEPVPVPACS